MGRRRPGTITGHTKHPTATSSGEIQSGVFGLGPPPPHSKRILCAATVFPIARKHGCPGRRSPSSSPCCRTVPSPNARASRNSSPKPPGAATSPCCKFSTPLTPEQLARIESLRALAAKKKRRAAEVLLAEDLPEEAGALDKAADAAEAEAAAIQSGNPVAVAEFVKTSRATSGMPYFPIRQATARELRKIFSNLMSGQRKVPCLKR